MFAKSNTDHMLSAGTTYVRICQGRVKAYRNRGREIIGSIVDITRESGQFLGGQVFEGAALALQSFLDSQGDFVQLGRLDGGGQLGELDRVELCQVLPSTVELLLDLEGRLAKLGVRLGRAAEDQCLVAASEALLVVAVVETESDQGGTEASRLGARMLLQNHRSGDLSRGGAESKPDRAGAHFTNTPLGPARHAIVLSDSLRPSNSTGRENRAPRADATGNGLTIRPGNPLQPSERPETRRGP